MNAKRLGVRQSSGALEAGKKIRDDWDHRRSNSLYAVVEKKHSFRVHADGAFGCHRHHRNSRCSVVANIKSFDAKSAPDSLVVGGWFFSSNQV